MRASRSENAAILLTGAIALTSGAALAGCSSTSAGSPGDGGAREGDGASAAVDGGATIDGAASDASGQDASTDAAPATDGPLDGAVLDATTTGTMATGEAGGSPSDAGSDAVATDAGAVGSSEGSSGACGGAYAGMLAGTYWSSSLVLGIPLPASGQLTMTLVPAAGNGATCASDGGGDAADCDDAFVVQDGAVKGVEAQPGDGAVGGFPFACTLAGALDCRTGAFTGGWIECTYCIGPLLDSGTGCNLVGGRFAGTFTASYDLTIHAFVDGQWNASEALAGNDGGSPGPEGGPPSAYLSDSGVYGVGDYGGSGTWSATAQ
jgi:hypothetical protein